MGASSFFERTAVSASEVQTAKAMNVRFQESESGSGRLWEGGAIISRWQGEVAGAFK